MPFLFNGDDILPCEGLVKFNGVNVRELRFNGVSVHNGIWPPGEATAMNATDDECEVVTLKWTDPVDPGSGTYVYDLYENGIKIDTNVTSPYTRTIRTSTPKSYHVVSIGSDCPDEKAAIPEDGASTWKSDSPTGFTASNTLCEEIQFMWSNPAEDGFPDAVYNIMQGGSIVPGGDDVTSPITLPLLDETLLPYRVEARNKCGFNDSNIDNGQAATPPNPINISASDDRCGNIRVTFTPELMTAQYDLWQGANLIQNNITSGFQYNETDRSVLPHHLVQTGHCPADVVNSNPNNGQIGWTPGAPTGLTATVNDTGLIGQIRLSWSAPADTGNPSCTYDLYLNGSGTASETGISSPYLYSTSDNGDISFTVKAKNTCGSSANSNSAIGNAYQKDGPKTTTFYSSGPMNIGVGHTKADVCVVGGAGGGAWRSSDDEHRGGGGAGGASATSNINNTSNFNVTIGPGGAGLSILGGYSGSPSSALGVTGAGGAAGHSNALIYYGQGGGSPAVCGFGAARDGNASTLSGNRSAGGQGRVGNGGSGESVGGSINGGTAAGGGASYGGVGGSGSGGNGVAVITTY